MKYVGVCAITLVAVLAGPARAGTAESDAFSRCLVENASPKDQAAFVRWMFTALSANPSVKSMVTLSQADRDASNQAMARTMERLVLEDCRREALSAIRSDGSNAISTAFDTFGRRAAEQLLSDKAAAAELEKMGSYLDTSKWEALGKEAGVTRKE